MNLFKRKSLLKKTKNETIFTKSILSKLLVPLMAITLLTGCTDSNVDTSDKQTQHIESSSVSDSSNTEIENTEESDVDTDEKEIVADSTIKELSEAEIHFINTGNSDAILIKQGGESALIDGGDNDDETLVVNYLRQNGVSKLKYVFSTHPDADHCGGLDAVLDNIDVENVYVANGSADTKTYRDFINSIANKGLYPSVPLLGSEHKLGTSTFKVVSVANTNDVNNNSICLLYTNGEDKVLLMGDAGKEIENNINVGKVDLIKIGHHGSKTSTSQSFLENHQCEQVVILTGKNNKYGHPHKEVMDLLQNKGIKVHRTDECGTIVFKSTGKGLTTTCKEASYTNGNESGSTTNNKPVTNTNTNVSVDTSNSQTVYWTANGKKYHSSPTCSNMKNPMSGTISQSGRTPCSKCY